MILNWNKVKTFLITIIIVLCLVELSGCQQTAKDTSYEQYSTLSITASTFEESLSTTYQSSVSSSSETIIVTETTEVLFGEEIPYTDIYGDEVDFFDICEAVESEINSLMCSSEYNEASHDERINLIFDLLESLSNDGIERYPFPLVVPDSYSYGAEGDIIGCDLVNGSRELILLSNSSEDMC